jgi:hypothetical protein
MRGDQADDDEEDERRPRAEAMSGAQERLDVVIVPAHTLVHDQRHRRRQPRR